MPWKSCSPRSMLRRRVRGEQLFHGIRRRRAKPLVEADRLRKFLPDEFVAPREFAVLCKPPIYTLGVRTIQSPGRVPWQQRLDLVVLTLFVDHAQGHLARFFTLSSQHAFTSKYGHDWK